MARQNPGRDEAARIRDRLARLEVERDALQARLAELKAQTPVVPGGSLAGGPVTERSPARQKVALFRSLFRGRNDVYPKRWENDRTGKSGYAPACGNEWEPQICGKPRIKCGTCTNQDRHPPAWRDTLPFVPMKGGAPPHGAVDPVTDIVL